MCVVVCYVISRPDSEQTFGCDASDNPQTVDAYIKKSFHFHEAAQRAAPFPTSLPSALRCSRVTEDLERCVFFLWVSNRTLSV